jgi:4'-phosphopantetheinyl transferase
MNIATRYFTPIESSALEALATPARVRRFVELWTLKEAYLKARGLGLSIPLDAIAFEVSGELPSRVDVRFDSAQADDPSRWQFSVNWVDDAHVVATAIARGVDSGVVPKLTPTTLEALSQSHGS